MKLLVLFVRLFVYLRILIALCNLLLNLDICTRHFHFAKYNFPIKQGNLRGNASELS